MEKLSDLSQVLQVNRRDMHMSFKLYIHILQMIWHYFPRLHDFSYFTIDYSHVYVLKFWYLSQTPVLYLQCLYLNLQLDITFVSQSQHINTEFILSIKNHHVVDYPNFLHLNSSGLLTQNRSFFASPTSPFLPGV